MGSGRKTCSTPDAISHTPLIPSKLIDGAFAGFLDFSILSSLLFLRLIHSLQRLVELRYNRCPGSEVTVSHLSVSESALFHREGLKNGC